MNGQQRVGPTAERIDQHRTTVWRVCQRYNTVGLLALYDAPRSRRKGKNHSSSDFSAPLSCGA
jgi:hypothetical protein